MNNLCIDIGNTRVKYQFFTSQSTGKIIQTNKIKKEIIQKIVEKHQIEHIAISSVRKNIPKKSYEWPKQTKITILNHKTKIPITNKYLSPKTLGNDRLASIIGAQSLYPNCNILVIDFGTCIKFDFINKKGEYLGGNISPGVMMRIRAMHEFTSQLPLVDFQYNKNLLGQNTKMALQNGAVRGTIFEIESFIHRMQEKYSKIKIIFTGGDAIFFASYTNYKIFVHQNLVLQGLNKTIEHNEH